MIDKPAPTALRNSVRIGGYGHFTIAVREVQFSISGDGVFLDVAYDEPLPAP